MGPAHQWPQTNGYCHEFSMVNIQGHVDCVHILFITEFYCFPTSFYRQFVYCFKKKKKKEHRVKHICLTLTVKVCIAWLFGFHHHTYLF